ncbi:MAG TPA: tRNA pseudouridine(38-40) synthase TruA [Puia sp.]|nr:tRNA pseudouridine(38-40) synthase TruA [Puia sp.]
MPRYFLEVAYKGTRYSGFQIQDNANSVQEEVEKAFAVYFRQRVDMTGSSRTDTGVHALQNFFHFDFLGPIDPAALYHINAILPEDIVVRRFYHVDSDYHCRFDAIGREYQYYIYRTKDPFLRERAYYFPYTLDMDALQSAAALVEEYSDFTTFSKRNTQTKTFLCTITKSVWTRSEDCNVYEVKANRFLRGMVRGLVGTMLQVGRGKINLDEFRSIIESRDCMQADFSVPAHGLFLSAVNYPEGALVPINS